MASAGAEWRLVLCDLWGNYMAFLTGIASDIEVSFQLNRPAGLNFTVPSDNPLVSNLWRSTQQPWLNCGNRLIKAYRSAPDAGPGTWELQYVGRIWDLNDEGDETNDTSVRTAITTFDPLMDLARRLCRRQDGTFNQQVYFGGVKGDEIIEALIARTNTYGERPTLIHALGGLFHDTAPQTAAYDQAYILPSLIALTDTGTVDLTVDYLDNTDNTYSLPFPFAANLGARPRRGSNRRNTVIGYAGPPRNASGYSRTQSMVDFANDITLWGKSTHGSKSRWTDSDSLDRYGSFEDAQVLTDIEYGPLVTSLGRELIAMRSVPRDLISFKPMPELSAAPFDDYNVGDTITVQAASYLGNPETRQNAEGFQRVYGFTIQVDDEYGEQVSQLLVSPQDLSQTAPS